MTKRFAVLTISIAFLVGCGGGESAKAPPAKGTPAAEPSAATTPAAKDDPVKPPTLPPRVVIFSARELAKVLDVAALPIVEGTKFLVFSTPSMSAYVPGTMTEAAEFYEKTFAALGWTKFDPPDNRPMTATYGQLYFAKDGHVARLEVGASDEKGKKPVASVSLDFHGNLDTRALPRHPGTPDAYSSQILSSYFSKNSPAEEAAWLAGELKKDGWEEYASYRDTIPKSKDRADLSFRKQGYLLSAYIGPGKDRETNVTYSIRTLAHELPAPPGATKVRFSDHDWKMDCEVAGDFKAAAEFYQKAMPDAGYKPLPGEDPQPKYWNLRFGTDANDVVMVQVASKDGATTQVSIFGVSAATLAEMKKREEKRIAELTKPKAPKKAPAESPPAGPEIFASDIPLAKDATSVALKEAGREIVFKSKSAVTALAAELRELLTKAGWNEEKVGAVVDKNAGVLHFKNGPATLRVLMINTGLGDGTRVTIATTGVSFRKKSE